MADSNNDPFTKPRGAGKSPYWLRKASPKNLAKHARLIAIAETGARLTKPKPKETK